VHRQTPERRCMNAYFSWQHAILNSELEPTTRLVCLTIGCHMALDGSGCFPSYATISKESGLSRRTVIEHVQAAAVHGFLRIEHRERENGSSTSNLYQPTMPEAVPLLHQGGDPAALGVVQELHPHNIPSLTPHRNNQPSTPSRFEEFWSAWPQHDRKQDKVKCRRRWEAANLDALADAILAALERFKQSRDWLKDRGQYIPAPIVWLNNNRWETPPAVVQKTIIPDNECAFLTMEDFSKITPIFNS
jgi:hypothetical protein